MFKNKKAEKMFSFIWIAEILVVAGVFAIGLYMLYSTEFEIRDKEAEILYNQIYDCITEQGIVLSSFMLDNFDVFSECNLNKEIFDKSFFAFNISFYNENNLIKKSISKGFRDISQKCEIKGDKSKLPNCFEKRVLVLYEEENEIKKGYLNIITASENKGGKK
jgi:hypothetical protein